MRSATLPDCGPGLLVPLLPVLDRRADRSQRLHRWHRALRHLDAGTRRMGETASEDTHGARSSVALQEWVSTSDVRSRRGDHLQANRRWHRDDRPQSANASRHRAWVNAAAGQGRVPLVRQNSVQHLRARCWSTDLTIKNRRVSEITVSLYTDYDHVRRPVDPRCGRS